MTVEVLSTGFSIETLRVMLFIFCMVLVALTDWQHYLISNKVLLWSLGLAIALKCTEDFSSLWPALIALGVSFAVVLLILSLGNTFLGRPTMGMGDVKLAGLIGFTLGLPGMLFSLWLAAAGALVYVAARKLLSVAPARQNGLAEQHPGQVPFGSFFAITSGALAMIETNIEDIFTLTGLPWLSL